jgi:hypothetical protein
MVYGTWVYEDHPDGPLPLNVYAAGAGAMLCGDPAWWKTHWYIRMAATTLDDPDRAPREPRDDAEPYLISDDE